MFAEAVNTEINCMHVQKVFALRRRQKKLFSVGAAGKKRLRFKIFHPFPPPPPPPSKIMVRPLVSLARANHSLGSVSKIWIPAREGTGTFEKRNPGRYQKTYGENLLWMMNYLWLWIYIVKLLICHRWRFSWSWICLHKLIKLRAFSGMLPSHVLRSSTFCTDSFARGVGGEWIPLDVAVRGSISPQRQWSSLAPLNPMVHPCSLFLMSQKIIKIIFSSTANLISFR